ncbi:PP2C family protein-serine/threonine phosphatase, partial [Bacteroidota bacterium]
NREKQLALDLQEAQLKKQEAEIKNRNNLIKAAIVSLALILVIAIITFRNYKQKKAANELLAKQNKEISTKNKNIEHSINYAQRIQEAMLPDINSLSKYLPDSFILFKPRDVVSGDFYWFIDPYKLHLNLENFNGDETQVSHKTAKLKDNNFIIAAVDCTGHGVPGAFMSMIGMNLLYELVSHGVVDADEILNKLHEGIRTALKQQKTDNQDGMDITICVIKNKDKIVEYAGAKNPLLYIQDGELNKIKGDRYAVGGPQYEEIRKYKKHIINIDKPTTFYIYSDGYQDQFGGPKNMKFLTSQFKNLLVEVSNEDFLKQKEILDRTIEDWKENVKQTDDILVIGFKLS